MDFVNVSKRFITGRGCQPGVMPSHIGIIKHDPFKTQTELSLIGSHPGGSVQVGNDRSVIDNDHDLAFIRDVNDVVVQMREIFRFAEWESSLNKTFTMHGNEEIHMLKSQNSIESQNTT